jgi:hypothetical protein
MNFMENNGVVVHGGSLNAEVLAVGDQARAIKKTIREQLASEDNEIARRLAALVEELHQHADQLPNTAELLDATETVAREVAKDAPNPVTIRAILTSLASGVRSVGSAATAVAAVADAVNAVF